MTKVVVYGTLMTDEHNYPVASDAQKREKCRIKGWLYDTGWGFPAFVPDEKGMDIKAELLTVSAQTLARMDRLEGAPHFYYRQEIDAITREDGEPQRAQVYVMNALPAGATRMQTSWPDRFRESPTPPWRKNTDN